MKSIITNVAAAATIVLAISVAGIHSGSAFADETKNPAIVVGPGDAKTVPVFGAEVSFLVLGKQTGGKDAAIIFATPKGYKGPALHVHPETAETIYILEGEFTMWVNKDKFTASAGTYIRVPRNTPHTFANVSDGVSKLMVFFTPAGREMLFWEGAELEKKAGGRLPPETVAELYAKFDTRIVK